MGSREKMQCQTMTVRRNTWLDKPEWSRHLTLGAKGDSEGQPPSGSQIQQKREKKP